MQGPVLGDVGAQRETGGLSVEPARQESQGERLECIVDAQLKVERRHGSWAGEGSLDGRQRFLPPESCDALAA